MKPALVVDIETDGTPWEPAALITVSWQEVGEPTAHVATEEHVPASVWEMMADPDRAFVSHTKYDARFLRLRGYDVSGPYYDTQVMAWVLNENQSLSLESLARRYCRVEMDKRIRIRDKRVFFLCDDGAVVPIAEAPLDQVYAYNVRDVETTTELFETLWERLDAGDWHDYWLAEEVPFTEALLQTEVNGLPINLEASEELRQELEVTHAESIITLHEMAKLPASFNLNSGKQLASFLFQKTFELTDVLTWDPEWTTFACEALKSCLDGQHDDCIDYGYEMETQHVIDLLPPGFTIVKVGRTQVQGLWTLRGLGLPVGANAPKCVKGECDCKGGKHKPSTAAPALKMNMKAIADPWVGEYLGYRKVDKVLTTYLRRFPEVAVEGRIYARFNQTGTKTGRLSSSEPNLQNIPAHGGLGDRLRALFQAPPTTSLIVGDYSQLEPRLMAHFSQDPFLVMVYREGLDIYREIASRIFGVDVDDVDDEQRGIAKTLVLAMGYGAGAKKVAEILTINGYPTDGVTAKGYLLELHDIVSVFFEWREQVITRVKRTGYVQTIGGRHRRLKAAFQDRRNFKNIGYGERQAVNAVVQGSAGDVVRRVMVAARRAYPTLSLLAQVHDELLWETPDSPYNVHENILHELRDLAQDGHGYELNVPLKFEPVFAENWSQKGTGIELPEDMEDASHDFEEDR